MQKKTFMQEMRDKKAIKHIESKQQNDISFFISNYFKCKRTNSNQKTDWQIGQTNAIQVFAICKRLTLDPATQKS